MSWPRRPRLCIFWRTELSFHRLRSRSNLSSTGSDAVNLSQFLSGSFFSNSSLCNWRCFFYRVCVINLLPTRRRFEDESQQNVFQYFVDAYDAMQCPSSQSNHNGWNQLKIKWWGEKRKWPQKRSWKLRRSENEVTPGVTEERVDKR